MKSVSHEVRRVIGNVEAELRELAGTALAAGDLASTGFALTAAYWLDMEKTTFLLEHPPSDEGPAAPDGGEPAAPAPARHRHRFVFEGNAKCACGEWKRGHAPAAGGAP